MILFSDAFIIIFIEDCAKISWNFQSIRKKAWFTENLGLPSETHGWCYGRPLVSVESTKILKGKVFNDHCDKCYVWDSTSTRQTPLLVGTG